MGIRALPLQQARGMQRRREHDLPLGVPREEDQQEAPKGMICGWERTEKGQGGGNLKGEGVFTVFLLFF